VLLIEHTASWKLQCSNVDFTVHNGVVAGSGAVRTLSKTFFSCPKIFVQKCKIWCWNPLWV